MKTLLAILFAIGALVVGSAVSGASTGFSASLLPHFGGPGSHQSTGATGPIKATPDFDCGGITCAAYEAGVNGFLQDVAADSGGTNNVYGVATEYSGQVGPTGVGPTGFGPTGVGPTGVSGDIAYSDTLAGTYEDTHRFPANGCNPGSAPACLSEGQLVTEIHRVMDLNGWTASGNNLFMILLPANVDTCVFGSYICASDYFCAYHDSESEAPGSMIFAVEPFDASFGCDASSEPTNPQGFPNGPEIDQEVNTISHETNEAVTDPYLNAWYSNRGEENADKCAWWFGAPVGVDGVQPYNQVINGHHYSLQQEWSNMANSTYPGGSCLQHPGGTESSPSPYVRDNGPLYWHGGPVMGTANVYTIFWIPGPTPALTSAPVVKGNAAVAQTLTTTNGVWTNSPTSYTYKWLRCDNAGDNCIPIGGATGQKYTVLSGDAGHTLRSLVLAHNVNGSASGGYAQSAPSAVVVSRPTVITLPVISGTAQSGQTLSVSKGTWTNSPTKFAYQWLRCSSTGTSCKAISTALNRTYKVKSTDIGHVLAAQVTASNAAGRGKATVKTGVVPS